MLCVVLSHQELSGDPQYAAIAPVCVQKVCSGDDRQKFSFIGQFQSADSLN
jgi:hypothetical protein